jgi:hypothetical protein
MLLLVLLSLLVNGLVDCVVVAWLAGRRSRQALMSMVHQAAEGDPEAQQFVHDLGEVLLKWGMTPIIKTGKKITSTNDDGDTVEIDEIISPMDMIMRTSGKYIVQLIKGQAGGVKSQMTRALQDELALSGSSLSSAALSALTKGRVGPALAEVGLPWIMQKLKYNKSDNPLDKLGG